MAKIVWGGAGERYFETGLDRGVFFINLDTGVPWNGLISVTESSGGSPRPFYLDGQKFLNLSGVEDFKATIESFFAPAGFEVCDGHAAISPGLFATQQPRKPFNFSYRTLLGNDVDGTLHAYKIHLVYNALASPADMQRQSISDSTEASKLSWSITTLPPELTGFRPTAHFMIDSRSTDSEILSTFEDLLYGTDLTEPRMPGVAELLSIFGG